MKSRLLVALLLVAGTALAAPAPDLDVNGLPFTPAPSPRAVIDERAACDADNLLRALRNPQNSVSASAFCSGYLQKTVSQVFSTSTTITRVFSITRTTTTMTTTTTSTTAVVTSSVPVCGLQGYGQQTYLQSDQYGLSRDQCIGKCLNTPNCKSYGIRSSDGYCATFSVSANTNVFRRPDTGYFFYDVDCPYYADNKKRDVPVCAVNPSSIPPYLYPQSSFPPTRYSSACSCFIASASSTCTSYSTVASTFSALSLTITTTTASETITSIIATTTTTSISRP